MPCLGAWKGIEGLKRIKKMDGGFLPSIFAFRLFCDKMIGAK
jgi:hypothetical protein